MEGEVERDEPDRPTLRSADRSPLRVRGLSQGCFDLSELGVEIVGDSSPMRSDARIVPYKARRYTQNVIGSLRGQRGVVTQLTPNAFDDEGNFGVGVHDHGTALRDIVKTPPCRRGLLALRHESMRASPATATNWNETIDAHRHAVRDAILDTTATLAAEHGPASVSMSQIAEATGIGRATLYKYFPAVEAILFAWHERQITAHLEQLKEIRDRAGDARERLQAVLEAYAPIAHERQRHGGELGAPLHSGGHVARAQQQLTAFITDLVAEGAKTGDLRDDVPPEELASYCLYALAAAGTVRSKAAVGRLISVTLAGLRPAR